jgi:hypothetical protein
MVFWCGRVRNNGLAKRAFFGLGIVVKLEQLIDFFVDILYIIP